MMRRISAVAAVAVALSFAGGQRTVVADAQVVNGAPARRSAVVTPDVRAKLFSLVTQRPSSRYTRSRHVPSTFTVDTVLVNTQRQLPLRNAGSSAMILDRIKKCEAGDPSVPPQIDKLKGKIGSGGYLVIDGECFGDSGAVEFVGDFPGGRLALQTQAWSHTSITAGIPSLSGVYDQIVRIRVVRGNVVSNEVAHRFVPDMEERIAPASMIVNLVCEFDLGGCKDGIARHFETTDWMFTATASNGRPSVESGTDRWEVKPPPGWRVDSIDWTTNIGTTKLGSDFDSSPATDLVFSMGWENNDVGGSSGFLGLGLGDKDRYFAAVYSMQMHLVGPKGTWR